MPSHRRHALVVGFALAAVTVAVYAQVNSFDFVEIDDRTYVAECPWVQRGLTAAGVRDVFTMFRTGNWHPLTWLSLMADRQLFGMKPGAFHLTNLALHVAGTLLLFAALVHMTDAPWRSGLVAALFALHPVHVESVAWVAERKDVLSGLFWMLTLYCYSRYARSLSTG